MSMNKLDQSAAQHITIEKACEMFNDELKKSEKPVVLLGMEYDPSYVLREINPRVYHETMRSWLSSNNFTIDSNRVDDRQRGDKMDKFEKFAMEQFIQHIPKNKSYQEVFDIIIKEEGFPKNCKTVKCWALYDDCWAETLINEIEAFKNKLQYLF